jgi:hypothetical protein
MVFSFKAGFARSLKRNFCWLQILLLAAALGLHGCGGTTNIITGLSFSERSQRPNTFCDAVDASLRAQCTPELLESLRFAEIGKSIAVSPMGTGTCEAASLDFGDGTPPLRLTFFKINDTPPMKITHTYNGWPGKKLVRVKGESGCLGDVTKEIT